MVVVVVALAHDKFSTSSDCDLSAVASFAFWRWFAWRCCCCFVPYLAPANDYCCCQLAHLEAKSLWFCCSSRQQPYSEHLNSSTSSTTTGIVYHFLQSRTFTYRPTFNCCCCCCEFLSVCTIFFSLFGMVMWLLLLVWPETVAFGDRTAVSSVSYAVTVSTTLDDICPVCLIIYNNYMLFTKCCYCCSVLYLHSFSFWLWWFCLRILAYSLLSVCNNVCKTLKWLAHIGMREQDTAAYCLDIQSNVVIGAIGLLFLFFSCLRVLSALALYLSILPN